MAGNSGVSLSGSLVIVVLVSMGFSSSFLFTPEKLGTGSSSGSLLKKQNMYYLQYNNLNEVHF